MEYKPQNKTARAGKSYPDRSTLSLYASRIPWLLFLMLSSTLTGTVISAFESAISTSIYLTAFIPMLMGTGGNAGSQASVTVIRALSLGEITPSSLLYVIRKELRVALLSALLLGVVAYGKIYLFDCFIFRSISEGEAVYAAPVVALSLFFTVLIANGIGATLPFLAKKLRIDPAVMASPFITTAVDTISLVLYFEVARFLIPGM